MKIEGRVLMGIAVVSLLIISNAPFAFAQAGTQADPQVRMIYLAPADRPFRTDYAIAMENAIRHVQIWYHEEMDGKTFNLHKPVVEVYRTPHTAQYYATNAVGSFPDLWFFFNAVTDGFALTGGMFNDPNNRWIFYLDADTVCGQAVGATSGVALVAANDLRGLVGEANVPACVDEAPDTAGLCRWVGGLGHELGHTFGLAHPEPCPGGPADNALLCLGYIIYPSTYLRPEDKAILNLSTFFSPIKKLKEQKIKRFGCELR